MPLQIKRNANIPTDKVNGVLLSPPFCLTEQRGPALSSRGVLLVRAEHL
ncbi:hypothetical protein PG637_06930 [Riemerella anatipestifer]|nr:hypothetical protein [Riemerella anatipestifer]MDY3325402.1 hypothetical protein [Riemerella anatipestifer]MDY3352608.1 hypothetical protein [Riemerella anatipestifer]